VQNTLYTQVASQWAIIKRDCGVNDQSQNTKRLAESKSFQKNTQSKKPFIKNF
jgi:hypothetical protein